MYIEVRSERYNPFISVEETAKKGKGCIRTVGYALAARGIAIGWAVMGIIELPFLMIGTFFKAFEGSLTLVLAGVTRNKSRWKKGIGGLTWGIKNLTGLVNAIAVALLATFILEIAFSCWKLHTFDQRVFIPWCRKEESGPIQLVANSELPGLKGYGFNFAVVNGAPDGNAMPQLVLRNMPNPKDGQLTEMVISTNSNDETAVYSAFRQPFTVKVYPS